MKLLIRDERPADHAAIRQLIDAAFAGAPHSSGSEAAIVDRLRAADALTVSLVAERADEIVGHAAVSPVSVERAAGAWFGLGPVAVRPDLQRGGIGEALVRRALERLERSGASGCVVLGNPAYYGRFGFAHDPRLTYAGAPPPYFQARPFGAARASGAVLYHPAFG